MSRKGWLVGGGAVLIAAIVAAVAFAWLSSGDDGGTSAVQRKLQTVSDTVGFQADVPTFFPTSATRLVLVDSGTGPGSKVGGSLPLIELVYESDKKFSFKGQESPSTLDMFQVLARLNTPQGERLAVSNASFEIYRQIVTKDEAGAPLKATYTAVGATKTFVIDFTGEQPSDAGIVKMLESMRPAPKTP